VRGVGLLRAMLLCHLGSVGPVLAAAIVLTITVPLGAVRAAASDEPPPQGPTETPTAAAAREPRARAATSYPVVVVETAEPGFTGEPITLSLKDADIKDVLKTFSTLTGLNIVVDPAVSGTVTVELRGVPWDQAFEIILTINGLGYDLLGNVVYVAPPSRLVRLPLYGRRY